MGKIMHIGRNSVVAFKDGFVHGLGWSFGVTIGFVLVSTLLVFALQTLGGLPFLGDRIAEIVHATEDSLSKRSLLNSQ